LNFWSGVELKARYFPAPFSVWTGTSEDDAEHD
jgi:hypothetical protein